MESGRLAKYLVGTYPELRDKVTPQTWEKVKTWQVQPFTLKPDAFEPYDEGCITLPLPREAVEVVSSEAQLMDIQWTAACYGVDTEWLPCITKFEKSYLTILTVASLEVT